MHFQVQVAGRALLGGGRSLAGETDQLALAHAGRDLHIQRARLQRHPTLVVHFRHAQGDSLLRAAPGVLDVQQDPGVVILTAHPGAASARVPSLPHAPEQLGEEVGEVPGVGAPKPRAREFEAGIPIRRRSKLLAGRMPGAERVVGGTLLGVGQHRVRLVDFLHPQLGVGFLADVRVVLARQPAKRLLDLIGAGVARHAQGFVIVLELQPAPPGHAKMS